MPFHQPLPNFPHPAFKTVSVYTCKCRTVHELLIANGLFPMSPKNPGRAISIFLLDFYRAIYEKSADAVYALSGALQNHYRRRGFPLETKKVPSSQ
jgi:hypothetical protein